MSFWYFNCICDQHPYSTTIAFTARIHRVGKQMMASFFTKNSGSLNRIAAHFRLTVFVLMDSSFWFDAINLGSYIVYNDTEMGVFST